MNQRVVGFIDGEYINTTIGEQIELENLKGFHLVKFIVTEGKTELVLESPFVERFSENGEPVYNDKDLSLLRNSDRVKLLAIIKGLYFTFDGYQVELCKSLEEMLEMRYTFYTYL